MAVDFEVKGCTMGWTMHIPWDGAGCLCPVGDLFNYFAPVEESDFDNVERRTHELALQDITAVKEETSYILDEEQLDSNSGRLTDGRFESDVCAYCFYAKKSYRKGEQTRSQQKNMSKTPKEKATASRNKRKVTTDDGQTAQKQPKKRRSPMTNNELRQMIKERNEYMRLRKASLKASKLEANKTAPKRTKIVQGASVQQSSRPATSAPTTRSGPNASTNNTAPSRTSQRIGQNSGKGVRR